MTGERFKRTAKLCLFAAVAFLTAKLCLTLTENFFYVAAVFRPGKWGPADSSARFRGLTHHLALAIVTRAIHRGVPTEAHSQTEFTSTESFRRGTRPRSRGLSCKTDLLDDN